LSIWKHTVVNAEGVIEPVLSRSEWLSADGKVSHLSYDDAHTASSSVPASSQHTDTDALCGHLLAGGTQSLGETVIAEETVAPEPSDTSADDRSKEVCTSEGPTGAGFTDGESISVSEKQQSEVSRSLSAGAVDASGPQDNVPPSTETGSVEPVQSQGDENLMSNVALTVSDHPAFSHSVTTTSNQLVISSSSADSETVDNASDETTLACATDDTDPPLADDSHSFSANELLLSENVQASAAEMVCGQPSLILP